MTDTLKSELLHILQHSLGLDQYGQGRQYRNHFVAGGENIARCRELVSLGHMVEHEPSFLTGGSLWFSVTPKGINAVALESPKPPKLTRGQQRYREYLDADGAFASFGDFLKHLSAKTRESHHDR